MGKFFLFSLMWWITGNPFVAILLLVILLYLLDLRFVRLLPNVFRPFQRSRQLAKLQQQLRLNPHDTSTRLEAARILMEKGRYQEALRFMEEMKGVMKDSAEYLCEYGICLLKIGELETGEQLIREALAKNPRVKYGEPYLHLSEAFAAKDTGRALGYLQELKALHSSSVEGYYRMGRLYQQLQQPESARQSFAEAADIYRGLPAYKKRSERRWAILAKWNAFRS